MKEGKNKILFYSVIIVTIISFVILGIVAKNEVSKFKENEILKNEEITKVEENKRINENYILNPNKVIDEFIFLTNTYEELNDIAIWYSEIDFHEFKEKIY